MGPVINGTNAAPLDVSSVPHASLLAQPKTPLGVDKLSGTVRKVYDLRKSHVAYFLLCLSRTDWCFVFYHKMSLDEKCAQFHQILNSVANECIPVSFVKYTPRDKPWISPVVKSLINARWTAFRSGNFAVYNHLKKKVRQEIRKAKIVWTRRAAGKNIWEAVNTNLGTRNKHPIDGLLHKFGNADEAVDHMNSALASHFQKKNLYSFPTTVSIEDSWKIEIDEQVVMNLLRSLQSKKSSFDIPNVLYKEAASLIVKPLTHLFSLSISHRHVPTIWKTGAVTPIPKTSKPSLDDIRPISILPTPAKLLETIVLRNTRKYFMTNFDKQQFGFRSGSSTLCALSFLEECVSRYLDDVSTAGVVLVSYDLSKAFDKLPHDKILQRLSDLSFPSGFVEWIASYLGQRQQFVRIGQHCSKVVSVTSGVPQGSILGPLLFVTTVGSYTSKSGSQVIKYADDTTICFPLFKEALDNCLNNIYREHERFLQWSQQVGLPINAGKSKCLTIKKAKNCEQPPCPNC